MIRRAINHNDRNSPTKQKIAINNNNNSKKRSNHLSNPNGRKIPVMTMMKAFTLFIITIIIFTHSVHLNEKGIIDTELDFRQRLHSFHHDNNNVAGGYDPFEIIFLNVSDASILKQKQPKPSSSSFEKFDIDILTIGSISSIPRAKTQLQTWGSHVSRRHYFLATEYDDPNPNCYTNLTFDDLVSLSYNCRIKGKHFWSKEHHAFNKLTSYWRNIFAQDKWLKQKSNPVGWVCAQKRFVIAFSKLMNIYRQGRNKYDIDLPDYLIFGDDDTYVHMEMMVKDLLRHPNRKVKEEQLTYDYEMNTMVYPTQHTPVVWAGCRVRRPSHIIHDTIPFGGFGVLFSKAAIERLIQPLYCNNNTTTTTTSSSSSSSSSKDELFEKEACEHFTPQYKDWTIDEYRYFEDGMSVSDLMGSYTRNLEPFCLHSGM